MSLLPSARSDVEATQEGDIRVVGVDRDDLDPVFDAIGPKMARNLLGEIYTNPGTPSALAERIETSVQNAMYHLDKLEQAKLIHVADTRYSEKGKEMKVYAPTDSSLVVFVGTQNRQSSFHQLVKRLLPAIGVLALVSVITQRVLQGDLPYINYAARGGTTEPALPLATAMFLGGVVMLMLIVFWWYWDRP